MRKVGIRFKLVWTSVLAVIVAAIVYNIPLVKYLIWLNAAAICSRWHSPWLFVWLALGAVFFFMAWAWVGFWKLANSIWE